MDLGPLVLLYAALALGVISIVGAVWVLLRRQ
jgi:hypothetical protein